MAKNIIIFLIWILFLSILFTSCYSSKQSIRLFKVTEIRGNEFTAVSGNKKATFIRVGCDSIYLNKTIEVSFNK